MRYSMKRAIAFVLSLTMALALPLTASAENSLITDIYEEDDSVGRVPGVDEDYVPTNSGSMSGSGTGSRTSPIKEDTSKPELPWTDEAIEARILGVVLDSDEIEIEAGLDTPKTVQATIIFDGGQNLDPEKKTQLYNYLSWEFETAKNGNQLDWSKAQVKFARKADGKCVITGLNGGRGYLNVWVDNAKTDIIKRGNSVWDKDYEAGIRVPVVVKEYASKIEGNDKAERTYFEKQKINLNDLVTMKDQDGNTIPNWNEQIGWTVADARNAKIDAKGVATLKKPQTEGEKNVTFYGIGERGARVELKLTVKPKNEATPVTKLEGNMKKATLDFGGEKKTEETLVVKATTKDGKATSDFVTWSVKKSDIVSIEPQGDAFANNAAQATIKALKVGKTTVTATASTGRKVNFSVQVNATLDKIIVEPKETVYVGQSVAIDVKREPEQNTEKLKWTVTEGKKFASVKNGIVTVKANAASESNPVIKISVSGKRGEHPEAIEIDTKVLALDQKSDLKKVIKDGNVILGRLGGVGKALKLYKDELYTRQGRNYNKDLYTNGATARLTLVSTAPQDANVFDAISWTTNKENVATITRDGKVKAVGKGTAKLTVTGLVQTGTDKKGAPKYKISKATVTLKVAQPVTRLVPKQSAVSLVQNKSGFKAVTVKVASYLPKGTKGKVTWTHADPSIAGVNPTNGKVTAGSKGDVPPSDFSDTSVTATEVNGANVTIDVGLRKATKSVQFAVPTNDYTDKAQDTFAKKLDVGEVKLFANANNSEKKDNQGFVLKVDGLDNAKNGSHSEYTTSYTVKGKGSVQVIAGADGEYRIIPVRAGNVTVTFKTPSGKSGKCTFKIVNK